MTKVAWVLELQKKCDAVVTSNTAVYDHIKNLHLVSTDNRDFGDVGAAMCDILQEMHVNLAHLKQQHSQKENTK